MSGQHLHELLFLGILIVNVHAKDPVYTRCERRVAQTLKFLLLSHQVQISDGHSVTGGGINEVPLALLKSEETALRSEKHQHLIT